MKPDKRVEEIVETFNVIIHRYEKGQDDADTFLRKVKNVNKTLTTITPYHQDLMSEVVEEKQKQAKRYITLMNQALGDTELPEEVWKKIAKVNQSVIDK